MKNIRNFSIIAHIDHGKSTLADRFLEITGTVEKRKMRAQVLDSMELERERGITIKMQPVHMIYAYKGENYQLNLIDTPGHVDFSYEVSRALLCCEGAILLVDATQGIEAQTLSHFYVAKKLGLTFIAVLNKIDLPHARVDEVKEELMELGGFAAEEILCVSAKDGRGVKNLLSAVVERMPPPRELGEKTRALVFDSSYESHKGVIAYVRVMGGSVKKGGRMYLFARKKSFIAKEVGIITPALRAADALGAGDVGYVVTAIKEPGEVRAGDTIMEERDKNTSIKPLEGYQEPMPVVWASFFPSDQGDFPLLGDSFSKLHLSDSSLSFSETKSIVLGKGYECGFLGTLHLEITAERLKREFKVDFVVTHPSVAYRVYSDGGMRVIASAAHYPRKHEADSVEELWMRIEIIAPRQYMPDVARVLESYEGKVGEIKDVGTHRLSIMATMPLRQMVTTFFDALKSATKGYASYSYGEDEWRPAKLARLDIFVEGEPVEALSRVVNMRDTEREARALVKKVKDALPRQLFQVKVQGVVEGRILAAETIRALSKDVTGYLYGGDRTRKMKLWKKQKEGKKRLRSRGKIEIPPDVFLKLLKM